MAVSCMRNKKCAIGSKGHETVKIFYADANARITQNRGFDGQTNGINSNDLT